MKISHIQIAGLLLLSSVAQAELREWTSSTGTKINAELLLQEDGMVKLRTEDGVLIELSEAKLSPGDRGYLVRHENVAKTSENDVRPWTDQAGKHAIDARFLEMKDSLVVLERTDGQQIKVPLKSFSLMDRRQVLRKIVPNGVGHFVKRAIKGGIDYFIWFDPADTVADTKGAHGMLVQFSFFALKDLKPQSVIMPIKLTQGNSKTDKQWMPSRNQSYDTLNADADVYGKGLAKFIINPTLQTSESCIELFDMRKSGVKCSNSLILSFDGRKLVTAKFLMPNE
jgi:hypothetical protein